MAKCQMVYLRLEAAVSGIVRIEKTRRLLRLRRAFFVCRHTAPSERPARLVRKLGASLRRFAGVPVNRAKLAVARAFSRWRGFAAIFRERKVAEKLFAEGEKKRLAELQAKDKDIASLETQQSSREDQISALKASETELHAAIKASEDKERTMSSALGKLTVGQLQRLETRARTLEGENQRLRDQLEGQESDMSAFVSEMNEVLDAAQFPGTAG